MESDKKNPHRVVMKPDDFNDLMKSNELRIAIFGAAKIEIYLDDLLSSAMVKDSKFVEDLLENAPLAIKIKTAYAFKLIDKNIRDELNCIRHIRNAFAHSADKDMSFNHKDVRKHYDKLSIVKNHKEKPCRQTDLFNQTVKKNLDRMFAMTLNTQYPALARAARRDSHT